MTTYVNYETSSMPFVISVADHQKEHEAVFQKTPKKKFVNLQGCSWWVEISASRYVFAPKHPTCHLKCYFYLEVTEEAMECGMKVNPYLKCGKSFYHSEYATSGSFDAQGFRERVPVHVENFKSVYMVEIDRSVATNENLDATFVISLKFDKVIKSVPESQSRKETVEHWMMTKPFSMMYNQNDFKDFTFIIGEQEFKVHKCVLAGSSEVLKTMFMSEFDEAKSNSSNITDIEPEVFQVLIDFIYGNKAEFYEKIKNFVYSVYAAADKYELKVLQNFCAEYIYENCTGLDRVIESHTFASFYDLKKLKEKCWNIIKIEILEDETLEPPQGKDVGTFFTQLKYFMEESGKIKNQIKQRMLKRFKAN